ncbi:hypothetical protein NQ314_011434 [Rhamnusium bicolor]|uniref:Uncharacterized protein n=1 Tax=Rhamnusium bicolor TaxID=1586634 RepID=A0AAV8XHZ9_9CUCU|nr:hypothetical protein NQ314_011434 [Rhamnusium bicolor]
MSGDSPNSHQNDIFDFKEGRSSPLPTTSKDVAIQSGEVVQASVLVEPDKDKEDDSKGLNSPILNNSSNDEHCKSDPDQTVQLDEMSYSGKRKGDKDDPEKKKLNGDFDKLDGVWVPSQGTKKINQRGGR